MQVPKTPCPIEGLVPWWGGIYPIRAKRAHPVLIWLYTIHTKAPDQAMTIHYNVCQEEIVREIDLRCQFKIHDTVELGPFARRTILGRRWDFLKGDVIYALEGSRPDRNVNGPDGNAPPHRRGLADVTAFSADMTSGVPLPTFAHAPALAYRLLQPLPSAR